MPGARLMFIQLSAPLIHRSVRALELEPDAVWRTDDDGQVTLPAREGLVFVEIEVAPDVWSGHRVDLSRQMITIVDVPAQPTSLEHGEQTGSFIVSRLNKLGDRYLFKRMLGRGGMGVVVLAEDVLLAREVAIKMLSEEFEEHEDAQHLFLLEARAIAALSHPNLVRVHDVVVEQGRTMMVFEYIVGESLEDLRETHGRLPEGAVVRAGLQLARALDYMHSQQLIHRDLKPSNALVQPDGELKIIDFGLSRSLDELAIKGTRVRGTPAYMAPEQIMGQELGPATDIYQIGVTLYELACGALPFTSGVGFAHVHEPPPPLGERVAIDPRLTALIHACLEKAPADRPTALALFEGLRALYAAHQAAYDAEPILGSARPEGLVATLRLDAAITGAPALAPARPLTLPDADEATSTTAQGPRAPRGPLMALMIIGVAILSLSVVLVGLLSREDTPTPDQPNSASTSAASPTTTATREPPEPTTTGGNTTATREPAETTTNGSTTATPPAPTRAVVTVTTSGQTTAEATSPAPQTTGGAAPDSAPKRAGAARTTSTTSTASSKPPARTAPKPPKARPEPRVKPTPEVKPEPTPEAKPAPKLTPEVKPEPTPEARPVTPEVKPEPTPAPKPEVKPEPKPEPKPAVKPEPKPEKPPEKKTEIPAVF